MSNLLLIKVGGGAGINWDYVAADLKKIIKKRKVIIVHGANAKRAEIAAKLNYPIKTITSPSGVQGAYTDKRSLEIFLMAYPGVVNKQIVAKLQAAGINAVGLSGVDGRLWEGTRKKSIQEKKGEKIKLITDNMTGRVEKINTKLINILIDGRFVPVICPPAISFESEIISPDGDGAMAMMAKVFEAQEIVFLFEARGLLKNINDKKTMIKEIKKENLDQHMQYAVGSMKKKLVGAKYALEKGVKKIYFGDGRVKDPISLALEGRGTVIS